nr:hypothetical protein [Tanacetum cinerariifolium]
MAKEAELAKSKNKDDPHRALKDKGIVDSGCSRHMTGNKAHLADYQEFKGGSVAFGGRNGRITSKGKIKAGKLDFEDVYYVEELKHYNLFSVSQMCDKKNKVLFTDIDCLVMSPDFKLHDENQVLLKILRRHNMLKGIKMKYSNARTPQQNGVVERKNKTLIEAARTMLADSFLPTTFWAEEVNTALENQANKSAGPKEANNSAGTQANDDQGANSEEIYLHEEHFVLPLWSSYSTTVKSSGDKIDKNTDFKSCEKPLSQVEQIFPEELEKLKRHKKEANDAARKETTHENQNAHTNITNLFITISMPLSAVGPSRAFNDGEPSCPDDPSMPHLEDIYTSPSEEIFTDSSYDDEDLPFRKKAIGTKWVYRSKKDKRGVVVRNKAQLVSQGHMQEEGIDYDEFFAFVARIKAIRIFLAFASYTGFIVYQMDVKCAFLYDTINEEVYVTQPPSFVDPKFPNKVYKVVKALYGLHQAPRAWYATLKKSWCDEFEELMKNRFQMSSMVELTFFLGLQVKQKEDGIFISQDNYVAEILKSFDFLSVKTASTPIETQKPFVKYEEAADVDVHLYRYLKGQSKLGLWYPKVSLFDLEAYSDSDYSGANLDRKSTTGGYQFLGRRLIFWQCKKQTMVAISTTEAEYVAAAHCDVIRQALHLNDANGVKCLPNEEIFIELTRMDYEKPPPKLTFYKAFFSTQWKFLIHTLVQCVSAKRIAWNEFSCSMTSAVICLATGRKFNFSKYIFDSMVRNVDSPSKFLMYPQFLQVIINAQVDDLSSHTNQYTSHALTQKVFANMRRVVGTRQNFLSIGDSQAQEEGQEVKKEEEIKVFWFKKVKKGGKIKAIDVDEDITLVDAETQVDMDAELQGRIDNVSAAATKEVNAAKPTVFDDEEKYQSLKRKPISIAQSRKNMIIYLKNMAGYKMEHFRGMTYNKKRVTEETLLHESFKKLKVVGVSGSHSTQDTITNDPREMSEEDVKNMLEIVPVSEFKVEALQVKVHHVSSTRRHDIFMLTEKNHPLSNAVMIMMLSAKLHVKEDSEMARDLVMKIFMEANKLKSRSLDTSSK